MSVDLSDEEIYPAYESIVRNQGNNWLLLKYTTRDKLFLSSTGSGGLDELKSEIVQDEIYFGFCRLQLSDNTPLVLFSYVPDGTTGVKRARALVHGRAVASRFQAHHATVNFTTVSQITPESILRELGFEDSSPPPSPVKPRKAIPPFPTSPRDDAQQSSRSKWLGKQRAPDRSEPLEVDAPPPTPPKPRYPMPMKSAIVARRTASEMAPRPVYQNHYVPSPAEEFRARSASPLYQNRHMEEESTPKPIDSDPEVQSRVRAEIRRLREQSEREIAESEAEANKVQRAVKPKHIEDDVSDTRERKEQEERERQRRMAQRILREKSYKEQQEKEQEERERQRIEQIERRLQLARIAQEKRERDDQERANSLRVESEIQKAKESISRAHLARVHSQFTAGKDPRAILLQGYISIQPGDAITWKRRYFEISQVSMKFFKDEKKSKPLETMPISGRIGGVKEWQEGFEELSAIPHSFAVVFNDAEPPWLFYAENGPDKEILVSLIQHSIR